MFENKILKIKSEVEKINSELLEMINKTKEPNKELIEILENNKMKLNNFEFVIAVVGTLKAGKSTTINAIIGQDLIPHRSEAMTTLPTLITHKKGQDNPILQLKKVDYLNVKLDEARLKLEENEDDYNEFDKTILEDTNFEFKKEFSGNETIKKCLTVLNDLMRVAKNLNLGNIYEELQNIDDLPRIKVEFEYLKNSKTYYESDITLLDTPGPNEYAYSEDLREIFKKQIKNSSAICLVVDYSNKGSEATKEIEKEIDTIKDFIKLENIFILINKFDQRKSGDPEYEKEISNFFKSLRISHILQENIYPISSIKAYYVTLARRELNTKGRIDKSLSWVKDFGKDFIGVEWEEIVHNKEKIEKICNIVWKDSYFKQPIENIIQKGFENSAFNTISSAIKVLKPISENILDKFNTTKNLTKLILEEQFTIFESQIENIQKNVENIEKVQNYFKDRDDESVFKDKFINIKEKINGELKQLKTYGDNLTFEYKEEAEKARVEIVNKVREKEKEILKIFNLRRDELCKTYIEDLNNDFKKQLNDIIEDVKNEFNFDLKIDLPNLSYLNGNIVDTSYDNIEIKSKEKENWYSGIIKKLDFFDKEWGINTVITRDDINKIEDSFKESIENIIIKSIDSDYASIKSKINSSIGGLKIKIKNLELEMYEIEKKSKDVNFNYELELASINENIYWIEELSKRIDIVNNEVQVINKESRI